MMGMGDLLSSASAMLEPVPQVEGGVAPPDGVVTIDLEDGSKITRAGTKLQAKGKTAMLPGPETWATMELLATVSVPVPTELTMEVNKLSKAKVPVLGSRKWQKRWVVVDHDSVRYYKDAECTKKAGETIKFRAGCWAKAVPASEGLFKNAFEKDPGISMMNPMAMFSETQGTVDKPNVVALHTPAKKNAAAGMADTLTAMEGANVFTMGAAAKKGQEGTRARTYYFECTTVDAAEALAAALDGNIRAGHSGVQGREAAIAVLTKSLAGAGIDVAKVNVGATIDYLYTSTNAIGGGPATSAASASSGGGAAHTFQ